MQKLEPLRAKSREALLEDPYLQDIVERNPEVAAQCCLDIANRIISLEAARKPQDYYEGIIRLGKIGVLPVEFARDFASIAGFRNILVHEYLDLDWDEVYANLQALDDMHIFAEQVRQWLENRERLNHEHSV